MGLATGGDDDDLGHGYIRRPISVAALLEREGYSPSARSKATRRALTGVAAGAVLALGAVVGSLFLNHGTTTTGDTLAAGQSGGDIVLAESGNQLGTTTTTNVPTQSLAGAPSSAPGTTSNGAQPAQHTQPAPRSADGHDGTISGSWAPAMNSGTQAAAPTTQNSAPTTQSTAPTTAPTTQSAPQSTTQSAPSTGTPTSTTAATGGPATTPHATTAAPSTSSTSSQGGGGLLGTVTGTLNDLTNPVFSWFGN